MEATTLAHPTPASLSSQPDLLLQELPGILPHLNPKEAGALSRLNKR